MVLFIHLLGAVIMGYYLIMPFFIGKLAGLNGETRKGFIGAVRMFNRIAQVILIVQLLSGGYMLSKSEYSTLWIVVSIVLLVLIGAFSGMMGRPMKRIMESSVDANSSDLNRIRIFSILVAVAFLAIVIIMYDPTLL